MHLLAATSANIGEGDEAIDLGQAPADVLILSAADSELAALSGVFAALPEKPFSLRLASINMLRHPMSVDMWVENTARHARLIIARVLGGHAYWAYGVEELQRIADEHGIKLALLPGGEVVDEDLVCRSTLPPEVCEALRALFAAGGAENARRILQACAALLGTHTPHAAIPAPVPLPQCGAWLEGEVVAGVEEALKRASRLAPVIFYRAWLQGGFTAPVAALAQALRNEGLTPLPLFVPSLKNPRARAFLNELFAQQPPAVIIDLTAFSAADDDPLQQPGCPVLQGFLVNAAEQAWRDNPQGLGPRDLAMLVALPELDGRIITRAAAFKEDTRLDEATQCRLLTYAPHAPGIAHIAALAARHARLRLIPNAEKRIALVLANYPASDGRLANGVGLDTPASTVAILRALQDAGYRLDYLPENGDALIRLLQTAPTNASGTANRQSDALLPLAAYEQHFNALPEQIRKQVEQRWGQPQDDPFFRDGSFHLPVKRLGEGVICAIQPARGYNIDPKSTYHDPALPPPHGYLAFYIWLRQVFGAHAVVHVGKHGNLEWLPGKALALSDACFPAAVFGPLPHFYPFIVNDPGEGAQAKRRTHAVIIDHLMPPLARAETYGPLAGLERLVDEYWQASATDAPRAEYLKERIIEQAEISGIAADAGLKQELRADPEGALAALDAWLCDLKEAQIRHGLHVLGHLPGQTLDNATATDTLAETLVALVRLPRGDGKGPNASLIGALADDLLPGFAPFDADMTAPWNGPRPPLLETLSTAPWRTAADARERLELLALKLARQVVEQHFSEGFSFPSLQGLTRQSGGSDLSPCSFQDARIKPGHDEKEDDITRAAPGPASALVLGQMAEELLPKLLQSAHDEIAHLLAGLAGNAVPPGPSGAPSRGRPDVLPTGRNFFSLDSRSLPTPAAWDLGRRSAENMLQRHFMEHGEYPRAIGLSCWGTANMRTGGDDIAQALALIGARPAWDHASGRVTGFEIITLAELGRPRVDVTLRVSGFFRDAFPQQMELFDRAVRAIGALEEPEEDNPIAAHMAEERQRLLAQGLDEKQAAHMAGWRIFGAEPGAYGAGLQALVDSGAWEQKADLAESWINWGAYAYGATDQGTRAEQALRQRLRKLDAIAHNQDNREHDLLDSDDYYQFEGGFAAAVEHVKGKAVPVWHNDHSRPEQPVTRSLEEEIARVVRARVVNPKWISAIMRHGYKGGFEMAATVDYMFAFAATTGAVRDHHFELAFDAFIRDDEVRQWLAEHNAQALEDMRQRFREALARGLWQPRANDVAILLEEETT